jgi:hypothetical protein
MNKLNVHIDRLRLLIEDSRLSMTKLNDIRNMIDRDSLSQDEYVRLYSNMYTDTMQVIDYTIRVLNELVTEELDHQISESIPLYMVYIKNRIGRDEILNIVDKCKNAIDHVEIDKLIHTHSNLVIKLNQVIEFLSYVKIIRSVVVCNMMKSLEMMSGILEY